MSLFDHLKGISFFIKSTPQSLHFYPSAKKIYEKENFFEKTEEKVRRFVWVHGNPYFIRFYKEIDRAENIKASNSLMKRFIVEIFQIIRRNWRLGERVTHQQMLVVPKRDHKKQLVLEKSAKHAKRRKNLSLIFERKMMRQAKQSLKSHNLSIFLAKRLSKMIKEIEKAEKSLEENYEIRLTTGLELDKQLWRLKTFKHT